MTDRSFSLVRLIRAMTGKPFNLVFVFVTYAFNNSSKALQSQDAYATCLRCRYRTRVQAGISYTQIYSLRQNCC